MSSFVKLGARFLVVMAIVSMVPILFQSTAGIPGPYVSALSNLAASPSLAASSCEFKDCAGGSRHNIVCAKVTSATNCVNSKGFCLPQNCQ